VWLGLPLDKVLLCENRGLFVLFGVFSECA